MKSAILALLPLVALAANQAKASVESQIVKTGTILKYEVPAGLEQAYADCLAVGNPKAADLFVDKYGALTEIWVDQIQVNPPEGNKMVYHARVSGSTASGWVHQYYEMDAIYERGCYVIPHLLNETKD